MAEELAPCRAGNGFYLGNPADFNAKYAIDETRFWNFLETTQKEELAKLQRSSDWQLKILERFDRMAKKHGALHLLRKGLEVDDAVFTLFYQLPLASSSKTVLDKFNSNQFSETRQIHSFNERWFQGWDETPEEQKICFFSLQKHILAHPDFKSKVADNKDVQNSELAFHKILDDVMTTQRRKELDLYKLYAKDDSFQWAFFDPMWRMALGPVEQRYEKSV